MRPLPGEDAYTGRSRSTSFTDNDTTPLATRNQPPQMTYFLADEKTMEESLSNSYSPSAPSKQRESPKDSTYGVESLESTISSIAQDSDDPEDKLRHARRNWKRNLGQPRPRSSDEDLSSVASGSRNVSPSPLQRRSSQTTISRPFTPLSFGSPAPPSLMSSPDSRRASDAGSYMDEVTSQAIASSGDEERDELVESGSAPQLVMPSIKMPSRRPFTERGKNMGRLKVLIAGDSGVGKTSLIKSIVQICEDIVHVDPLSPTPISIPETRRKSSRNKSRSGVEMQSTSQITEIYASTRAYPAWWSDLEESRILRRRKSLGDSVLERNLCFVDTPGYGNKTSCLECITPVVDYVESHFKKATSLDTLSEPDMISMLSGNGGSQVDLVLYVITQRIKPVDIEYLRRLSHLTNIIPVLSQTDVLSSSDISTLKDNITSELLASNIRTFQSGTSEGHQISSPYAISTTPSKDLDTMDASLLMSPDYVSPLVPSDLHTLVSQIFEPSSISWLRHSAAKKFITWRDNSSALTIPQSLSSPTSSFQSLTRPSASYALARINDHTQREERLSQIRLANWAADLQRSLQNERLRFETLAKNERAVWLTERLGECVQDGSIVPVSEAGKGLVTTNANEKSYCRKKPREAGSRMEMGVGMDRADPLGLLQLNAEMKRRGWVAVRVLSGFGILGGLAWWVVGTWQGAEETRVWGVGVRDWLDFGVGMGF
ncbi:Septin-5 [Lachnellula cervina]|uniref:Septin-5 n=1 Tax=Lachnellula cervina TaxID=1316786 RepID=A0A7D8YI79_9HELO|nr:Septin-5 [Lachnellula cervina]